MIQLNRGCISYDDVIQSLHLSGQGNIIFSDINAHAAVIMESAISSPVVSTRNQTVQLSKEVVGNDVNFIRNILNFLYSRTSGADHPSIDELKHEAAAFFQISQYPNRPGQDYAPGVDFRGKQESLSRLPSSSANYGQEYSSNRSTYADHHLPQYSGMMKQRSSYLDQEPPLSHMAEDQLLVPPLPPPPHHLNHQQSSSHQPYHHQHGFQQHYHGNQYHQQHQRPMYNRVEFERSEPIVRLLAQVRKVGMDILFPQSTHDKVI